jgi:SAM-dependent methyltransferase
VGSNVFQIDGLRTCFEDNEFDRVIIIDFLEHIHTDREFIDELFRVIKPEGELIINVPHLKPSLLRKIRLLIGQTDEEHGHVRPGYTIEGLHKLLEDRFTIVTHRTYSKSFSECIDTAVTFSLGILKKTRPKSLKGCLVTERDLDRYQRAFRFYSVIYPIVWSVAKLDSLVFWCSGYMLIVKARIKKPSSPDDLRHVLGAPSARANDNGYSRR